MELTHNEQLEVSQTKLTTDQRQLLQNAGSLVDFLIGFEEEADTEGLSAASRAAIRERVVASGLQAMNMPREWGGAGLDIFDQVLVMERLGFLSNHLWHLVWKPANVLRYCTVEQRERYLIPAIEGRLVDCYAVSEPQAGSDVRGINTTAIETADGYCLRGEKWFATAFDIAGVILVLAKVQPGDQLTLFLVDPNSSGLELQRIPRTLGTDIFNHPEFVLRDVMVPKDAILGGIGAGLELTREWFVEERLFIGARCVGAAQRALELASDWARERVQFGQPIIEHQLVQGVLADCAVEVALNRALLYQVSREASNGMNVKLLHAKAAMVKLSASEAAGRVVDQCLQLFGGRGYMRDHPVERLFRGVRAERIWEGASDIQRIIIANEIRKRGVGGLLSVASRVP